jgi:hypothetical protein
MSETCLSTEFRHTSTYCTFQISTEGFDFGMGHGQASERLDCKHSSGISDSILDISDSHREIVFVDHLAVTYLLVYSVMLMYSNVAQKARKMEFADAMHDVNSARIGAESCSGNRGLAHAQHTCNALGKIVGEGESQVAQDDVWSLAL